MCSDINITLSFNPTSDMNTTEFKRLKVDYYFTELEKALKTDGRYSPFIFKNDYRKSENYMQNVSNCIVLDFDDGMTRKEFKESANFAYAIGTTKSHMKDKNGKVCERFRVIIPTSTAIDLNSEQYSNMMREIFVLYPMADNACKDTARAYSGYSGSEVEVKLGELFNWETYHDKAEKRKALRKWQEEQKSKPDVQHDGTKADWYRENWLSDIMRYKLSVDEKFVTGNRNNALWSYAKYFKEIEFTDSEIISACEWINNGELDNFEMKSIFRSAKVRI